MNAPTASAWTSRSNAQAIGAAFNTCVDAVRRHGTVVQVGLHVRRCEVDPMLWALNDLTIVGSWCYGVNDWPRIAAQISTGRLPVERIITGRLSIDEATSGFERLTVGQRRRHEGAS